MTLTASLRASRGKFAFPEGTSIVREGDSEASAIAMEVSNKSIIYLFIFEKLVVPEI